MADIKTHLRELSVALGVRSVFSYEALLTFTPIQFIGLVKETVSNNVSAADNILSLQSFDTEHISIIRNGISLGQYISKKFNIESNDKIIWQGCNTQKDDPVDLVVAEYCFSLKESSFILENMGLYKFLSLLTSTTFARGLHVFEKFAPKQYQQWFSHTWSELLKTKTWTKRYPKYDSSFTVEGNFVFFNFCNKITCKVPISITQPNQFMECTNSTIREKIFSKWISESLKNDVKYLNLKKTCSETAGQNMCSYIKENLNQENLGRLLQLRASEYYYAKSTENELKVLKVPSINNYAQEIKVSSITYSVPKSQLNVITTIENTITGKTIEIRNECRFSHGQFNGTPEAKMYYSRDGDLTIIYTEI